MGLDGNLSSLSFAEILDALCKFNQEGVLTVFDEKRKKSIYFRNNGVTLIGGTQRLKIGDMLLHSGKIAPHELDRALAEQKATGRLLGEIVVEQGLVTTEEIEDIIAGQIEEEICDLFFWENAQFTFKEGTLEDSNDSTQVSLTFDVRRLLFRIADRIGEWENIRRQIPSFAVIFVPSKSNIDIDLAGKPEKPQNFERVLVHLNGANDVFDIIRLSQLSVLSVCRILLILIDQNAIRRATFEELVLTANELGQKTKTPKQIRILEQALLLRPNDEQLLVQITHAYENLGVGKKTAECYFKLGDKLFLSDPKNAIKNFERAIAHAPNFIEAYQKLLQLLEGNIQNELKYSKLLTNVYLQEKLYPKAEQIAFKYTEKSPEDLDFLRFLATAYLEQSKIKLASEVYETMANILERRNAWNDELFFLCKIIEIDPTRIDIQKRVKRIQNQLKWGKYRHLIIGGIILGIIGLGIISFAIYYELAARGLYEKAKECEFKNDVLAKKLYEDVIKNYPSSTIVDDSQSALESVQSRLAKGNKNTSKFALEREQIRLQQFEYIKTLAQSNKFSEARSYLNTYRQEYKEEKWQKMCDDTEQFILSREEQTLLQEYQSKIRTAKEKQKEGRLEVSLEIYQSLKNCKFTEIAKVANTSIQEIQTLRLKQFLSQSKQKFEEGNKEEKSNNFRNAKKLYEEVETFVQQAYEIKSISEEENREFSHLHQLALNGKNRIEDLNATADAYLKRAKELEQQGRIEESFRATLEVIEDAKLGKTEPAFKAYIPIRINTIPTGARIRDYPGKTPMVVQIDPKNVQKIEITYPGFNDSIISLSSKSSPIFEVTLQRKLAWTYDTIGPIWGTVVHYKSVSVLTSRSGKITALSAKDGKVLWEYQTRSGIGDVESSATIYSDKVYVGSNDNRLYCIDLDTGKLDWEFHSGDFVRISPVVEQDVVFFGNTNGKFFALNRHTGKKIWEYERAKASFSVTPTIWSNSVITGNNRGEIVALNLFDGSQLWTQNFEEPITTQLTIADKSLYFATVDGYLHCYNIESKTISWKNKVLGQIYCPPTMAGNILYIGTTSGYVYCISRYNGKVLWNKKITSSIRSALAIVDELMYVGSMDGYLHILDKDGELFWKGSFGSKPIRSHISYNEYGIFLGTEEGILYTLVR